MGVRMDTPADDTFNPTFKKTNLKTDDQIRRDLEVRAKATSSAPKSINCSLSDLGYDYKFRQAATLERAVVISAIQALNYEGKVKGSGYFFKVPSRGLDNHIYIEEYDQILLKETFYQRSLDNPKTANTAAITSCILSIILKSLLDNVKVTKRDIYYMNTDLFKSQAITDAVIDDIACMLNCTKTSLNIFAASKGVVIGNITFMEDNLTFDCRQQGKEGKTIPQEMEKVAIVDYNAFFILFVEKHAIFSLLAMEQFYDRFPCIILTGKGQPDRATRLFLRKLRMELQLPVLALMDCDPHGVQIMSVYASGSKNLSYENGQLTTPDVKWLGIRPSDIRKFNLPENVRSEMKPSDIKMVKTLLKEECIKSKPEWAQELRIMLETKEKAEIEALTCFGMKYLTEVYLPKKLQDLDYV